MDSVRSVLPKILAKRGLKDHAQAALIVHKAQLFLERVLPTLASEIRVQKMSQGTLIIAVTHSIAAQECQHLMPRLKEHLAKEYPELPVLEIRTIRSGKA